MKQMILNSYKMEIMKGIHKENHDYKMALYSGEYSQDIDSYNKIKNEASGQGYEKGGKSLQDIRINLHDNIATMDWLKNVTWENSTITAKNAMIYNNSLPKKNAVIIFDFEKEISSSNDIFIIEFPVIGKDTSLIRIE